MDDSEISLDESPTQTPLRRPPLIRLLRYMKKSIYNVNKSADKEHAENERIMARWTRYVGVFNIILAACAIANVILINRQLNEMHSGGIDTHNLAVAAHDQAVATDRMKGAGEAQAQALEKLRLAGEAQARAADRLRLAGESQALAMEGLRGAGEAQARSTAALADNSSRQIAALTESAAAANVEAESARLQSAAIAKSADATITASQATDRLALAGKQQADAVSQSLAVAKHANEIAMQTGAAEHRPWLEIGQPGENGPTVGPVAGNDYAVQIMLTNKGRSPGLMATVNIKLEIIAVSPSLIIGNLPPCEQNCQRTTVFPTAGSLTQSGFGYKPMIAAATMTKDEIDRISSFKDVILLRTRVDYMDASNTMHHTVGCSYYQPKLQGAGGFTSCLIGNEAD